MKRFLPILLNVGLCIVLMFGASKPAFASAVPFPSPDIPYTEDPEVNFVGKTDARAVQFLNWTLQNYEWACYSDPNAPPADPNDPKATGTRKCNNDANPLIKFWITIRNIIYALFALIVLITAFVLIVSRGKSLTIKRFLPRFVAVVLLVTLSYSLIQFIYTTVDIIQGFFLTKPPSTAGGPRELISSLDLLYVGWDYEFFRGLRKIHPYFDESVFVNLLLARLTAVTYYAMTGVLIIRKIILWFFIVLSPVFPILLLYYPVRNTAKIWIGEFFRWLLYAPLFSIFLSGLVSVWKSPRLPLIFDFTNVGKSFTYPTATNVLLGGPGQIVTAENNLNTPDTFALYVVALIMLWVVILLPFILLQIFLDYLNNFSFTDSPAMQKLINTSYLLLNKTPPAPVTPVPPPSTTGMAKQLPFAKYGAAKNLPIGQENPAGAAKQMPIAMPIGVARQTQTVMPVSTAQAQVNAEILNATNILIPTIRDIASFERQIISNRESSNVSRTYEALRQLANPANISNNTERDRFVQLKERLLQESRSGNDVASSIIKAVNVTSNVSTQNINNIKNLRKSLTKIANPQSVVSDVDKERITKLHDSLVKESQQGNTLATSILATKESATTKEVQEMKEKLIDATLQGNQAASEILTNAITQIDTKTTQKVVQQLANPASVTNTVTRERYEKVKDKIVQAQQQGNPLASVIMSTIESSTKQETAVDKSLNTKNIETLKEKLLEAKEKKEPLAGEVLSLFMTESTVPEVVAAPQSNRIQSVNMEDYEAVKKMWQENYNGLDVPEGITDRKAWITDDMNDIDMILSLLTSNDQQKVQEGMQEVGNVLPFLMLGGFSQEEIVSYLKAKREAGKSVVEELGKEEDTLISVDTHTAAKATMTRAATINDSVDEESALESVSQSTANVNINSELLSLTNLPLPTIRDVVKFEISLLSKDAGKQEEVAKVRETLAQIANPSAISSVEDRQRVDSIREILVQNSQQGDQLASSIVNAINHVAVSANGAPIAHITTNQVFQQIANPSAITQETYKQKMTAIHDRLIAEGGKDNQLAADLLKVSDATSTEEMQKLKEQVIEAKERQDPLGLELADLLPADVPSASSVNLPQSNRVQAVTGDDYQAVRQMWEDNYKNVDVPLGMSNRGEWIKGDVTNADRMIDLLSSSDPEKIQQGMRDVGNILPFLLLGGFSQGEIVEYLKVKKEAGQSVLQILEQEKGNEETLVTVKKKKTASQLQAAAAEITESSADTAQSQQDTVQNSIQSLTPNTQLLQKTRLPVPSIRDLMTYETALQTNNQEQLKQQEQIQSILKAIENPESITTVEEKTRIADVKQTLIQQSDQGDVHAKIILSAAKHAQDTRSIDQNNPVNIFQQYLLELVNPDQYPSAKDNEEIKKIHEMLTKEVKKKNILADRILLVAEQTPYDQIQELRQEIHTESDAGNPLAQKVWEYAPKESLVTAQAEGLGGLILPESNPIQVVDINDYEAVRGMWEDFYKNSEIPQGVTDKKEWLTKESDNIRLTLMLLSSNDKAKVQDGLTQVSSLLSFVLLGGFSLSEITAYLDAKLHAANAILQNIADNDAKEEESVDQPASSQSVKIDEMSVSATEEKSD